MRLTALWNKRFFVKAFLLAVLQSVAGCAGPGPTAVDDIAAPEVASATLTAPGAPTAAAGEQNLAAEEYRIGPQDLLELKVFGVKDLEREVRVSSSGSISLPLIGMVKAAGLTSQELEAELATQLAKDYLQNPQVSVFIKEYTSQRVTVEGEVKKPGIYPLKGRTTLLQALASAEGLTTLADLNVKVFRADPVTGNRKAMAFDLEKIREGVIHDPEVRNDDVIQVGQSQGKATAKQIIDFILPFRLLSPAL